MIPPCRLRLSLLGFFWVLPDRALRSCLYRSCDRDQIRIKKLDKLDAHQRTTTETIYGRAHLLIQDPDLHPRVPSVLFQNAAQSPPLQFPITSHDRPSPVSAHVTTY
jgi:hypothetical protein